MKSLSNFANTDAVPFPIGIKSDEIAKIVFDSDYETYVASLKINCALSPERNLYVLESDAFADARPILKLSCLISSHVVRSKLFFTSFKKALNFDFPLEKFNECLSGGFLLDVIRSSVRRLGKVCKVSSSVS